MRRPVLTLRQFALALALALPLSAQGRPLAQGDRIRLTVPTLGGNRFVGIVESAQADTILVRTKVGMLLAFPRDRVTQLEVSRGVRLPTWTKTALLWMPLAGALGGAIGGAAKPASRTSRKDSAEFVAIAGGLIGLVAGVVTVCAVNEREEWNTIPIRSTSRAALAPSLYIAPVAPGLTIGFRAAF